MSCDTLFIIVFQHDVERQNRLFDYQSPISSYSRKTNCYFGYVYGYGNLEVHLSSSSFELRYLSFLFPIRFLFTNFYSLLIFYESIRGRRVSMLRSFSLFFFFRRCKTTRFFVSKQQEKGNL